MHQVFARVDSKQKGVDLGIDEQLDQAGVGLVFVCGTPWELYYRHITKRIEKGIRVFFILARGDKFVSNAESIADHLIYDGKLTQVSRDFGMDVYQGEPIKSALIALVIPNIGPVGQHLSAVASIEIADAHSATGSSS